MKIVLYILTILIGAGLGFVYYKVIGCRGGG